MPADNETGPVGNTRSHPTLRTDIYDRLAADRADLRSPGDQAKAHGVNRTHWHRIRTGQRAITLPIALRVAADLRTTVETIVEPGSFE